LPRAVSSRAYSAASAGLQQQEGDQAKHSGIREYFAVTHRPMTSWLAWGRPSVQGSCSWGRNLTSPQIYGVTIPCESLRNARGVRGAEFLWQNRDRESSACLWAG